MKEETRLKKDYIQLCLYSHDILAKVKLQGQKTGLSLPGAGEYSKVIIYGSSCIPEHLPCSAMSEGGIGTVKYPSD